VVADHFRVLYYSLFVRCILTRALFFPLNTFVPRNRWRYLARRWFRDSTSSTFGLPAARNPGALAHAARPPVTHRDPRGRVPAPPLIQHRRQNHNAAVAAALGVGPRRPHAPPSQRAISGTRSVLSGRCHGASPTAEPQRLLAAAATPCGEPQASAIVRVRDEHPVTARGRGQHWATRWSAPKQGPYLPNTRVPHPPPPHAHNGAPPPLSRPAYCANPSYSLSTSAYVTTTSSSFSLLFSAKLRLVGSNSVKPIE